MSYGNDYAKNKSNNLSDFARKALVAVANNEARSDSESFTVSQPRGNGGYTFSPIQFDLKGNPNGAKEALAQVMTAAGAASDKLDAAEKDIGAYVASNGTTRLGADTLATLNAALGSAKGKDALMAASVTHLNETIKQVDAALAAADRTYAAQGKSYNLAGNDSLRLTLVDFRNQYGSDAWKAMNDFLNGTPQTKSAGGLPGGSSIVKIAEGAELQGLLKQHQDAWMAEAKATLAQSQSVFAAAA